MESIKDQKIKTSPKDFFLHLLSMVTLYAAATSLGTVFFQIINITIPDPLLSGYYDSLSARSILRNALSFVIVFFPAYLGLTVYLSKLYEKDENKRNLRIRRWLIYFTLFIAALIILFSITSLVNHLLDGELTLRFFLKLLTVVTISGSVLGYYFFDIKKHKTEAV